jgi:hypothetical protein
MCLYKTAVRLSQAIYIYTTASFKFPSRQVQLNHISLYHTLLHNIPPSHIPCRICQQARRYEIFPFISSHSLHFTSANDPPPLYSSHISSRRATSRSRYSVGMEYSGSRPNKTVFRGRDAGGVVVRLEGSGVGDGSMWWSDLGVGGCVLVGWVGWGAGADVLVGCLVGVWVEKADILEVGGV